MRKNLAQLTVILGIIATFVYIGRWCGAIETKQENYNNDIIELKEDIKEIKKDVKFILRGKYGREREDHIGIP